ncbi:camk family protein kinase [Colletotrichum truncatum]|uniref:Camk family protein kinase n=1 Tax=Colletotrichum truncatum TaxID=5467 RepID=A0ACC3ZFN3_COLTU|nr:camk family protein kinase [Colletotrichum truncatum]KAF6801825.1 camk family protein kinase [Colletotrichum truncatum]
MDHHTVIAWLLPSSTNQPALEAVRLPQNINRRIAAIPEAFEPLPTPNPNSYTINPSLLSKKSSASSLSKPRPALELSFTNPPKNHTGFVLGTDPGCDILLPKLPGISPRHCHITFDAERRLIVRDTSDAGTAIWYDGNSNGDRTRESWIVSSGCSYGFPAMVDRVVIDIQTVRFQIVVNDLHLGQPDVYEQQVDDFMDRLASLSLAEISCRGELALDLDFHNYGIDFAFDDLDFGYGYEYDEDDYGYDYEMDVDEKRDYLAPLPSEVAPVFVKYMFAADDGLPPDTYLWNTARPWEPMVKVTC